MPLFGQDNLDKYTQDLTGGFQPNNKIGPAPYASLIGSNAADIISSLYDASKYGTHEANPVWGGSNTAMTIGKAGLTVGMALAMRKMAQEGHPTAAKWIGYLSSIPPAVSTIHNMRIR